MEYTLDIEQSADYEQEFNVREADTTLTTLATLYTQVKAIFRSNYDGAALITLDTADNSLLISNAAPNLKFVFTGMATEALSETKGVFDVLGKKANGKFEVIFRGKWSLTKSVTRRY